MSRSRNGGANGSGVAIPLALLLVWLFFEFGRPPRTLGLPMVISVISVGLWLNRPNKQLGESGRWWFVMLAGMIIMIPLATNGFSAYKNTRLIAILFLTVCLPLQSLLRRVSDVRAWVYTFLAITTYVGIWATGNGGYGPSGAAGGQDENYIAALMVMSVPFAYFMLVAEKRKLLKLLLTASIVICIAAIGLADNASRGGFLALIAVGGYILARSPRKGVAFGMLGVASLALALVAGPAFWDEIATTTETDSGTGDLRIQIWTIGMRMFVANPVLGVGPGNFPWQLGNFQTTEEVMELGRNLGGSMVAHSMWVELVAELGLVGLGCTLALIWQAWKHLESVRERSAQLTRAQPRVNEFKEMQAFALAVQGGIIGIAVSGVFLSLLYYSHIWLLVAVANSLPFVLRRLESQYPTGNLVQPVPLPRGRASPRTQGRMPGQTMGLGPPRR